MNMQKDPWSSNQNSDSLPSLGKFEDNFVPEGKLPDSEEYIASLEKKLAKLKERQGKRDLVQSLEDTRKSCMFRLLSEGSSVNIQEDLALDTPVCSSLPGSTLLRHIAPDKQALTVGELVELLKADQLSEKLADNSDIEEKVNYPSS